MPNIFNTKIMLVEDSSLVALHIRKMLEVEGYQIMGTFASGEAALKALNKQIPDLILMDIMLEGELDGIETAKRIDEKVRVPIIYLSAMTDKVTIERAKITSTFGYIPKPVKSKELYTAIEMALHKSHAENELRKSRERFFSTVKSIGESLITLDKSENITYMNPRAEALAGVVFAQLREVKFSNTLCFFTEEQRALEPYNVYQAILQNEPLEERILLRNETNRSLNYVGDFSLAPVTNNKNEVDGYVLIFRDISARIKAEDERNLLRIKNITALIEGQEMERNRFSKELHDGLGQMLTVLKLQLEQIRVVEESEKDIAYLGEMLNQAISETKRISDNLMPRHLNELGLSECAASLCRSFAATSTTEVVFHSSIKTLDIAHPLKLNFYRIIQEALNNAIKYAEASCINVQLNNNNEFIFLTIEDDGVGFDLDHVLEQNVHSGRGILNMMDRVKMLGGQITFDSSPTFGTMISIEAPLKIIAYD